MTVAIIPARGGSKRIPGKNTKIFSGRPIIAYAIETAITSGLFDDVIVSTDDQKIAEVSESYGAKVPYRRPPELSDDYASTDAVLLHAVQKQLEISPSTKVACCIYPTTPFLLADDLRDGLKLLLDKRATCAFPVVKYDFPIEQALALDECHIRPVWPEKLTSRSQDLSEHYHDAGLFYWFDIHKFIAAGQLFVTDSVGFPIPRYRCQDINSLEDWEHAELKFKILGHSLRK